MAENKTQKTKNSVPAFIKIVDAGRQSDCKAIVKMMRQATGSKPAMWGESIIGFGDEHLIYASGRELDWFKIGFSPRKKEISLYLMFNNKSLSTLLKKLGPHRAGKGCLYIKSLEGLDLEVLQAIFEKAAKVYE
ncbi:MAG TPA: DUF1801 domain-containing protein [Phycisphaerales bacterium]|nr:DUF1801 domain-containing protein [Phycisphaerales bacterium]HIO52973.1 DUF1801 domain-containing protein [Phycisphaerales bacterium]